MFNVDVKAGTDNAIAVDGTATAELNARMANSPRRDLRVHFIEKIFALIAE